METELRSIPKYHWGICNNKLIMAMTSFQITMETF